MYINFKLSGKFWKFGSFIYNVDKKHYNKIVAHRKLLKASVKKMTQEEIAMIKAAMQNHENAFEDLFEHYYSMAYAMALRETKCDADAKDAVQEAFISIHKSIGELRDPKAFPAWLKMIVHSKCYKLFRKKQDIPSDPEVMNQSHCVEQRSYMNPIKHFNNENEKEVIRQLIQQLKPKHQEVVELVYLKQLKIEEAAKVLEVSVETVKTRLHRAKKDLSVLVKQFEKENDRKIKFKSNALIADTFMVVLFKQMQKQFIHTKEWISGNLLTSACVVSMSVLCVSGAVFVHDDMQKAKEHEAEIANTEEKETNSDLVKTENFNHSVFEAKSYHGMDITNSRSAYFTCVNFLMNDKEQKQSDERWNEILPVYESLKNKNDAYYQLLQDEGYSQAFEAK